MIDVTCSFSKYEVEMKCKDFSLLLSSLGMEKFIILPSIFTIQEVGMDLQQSFRKTGVTERTSFILLWMAGLSLRAIAEKMGTSATTVRRWVRRWQREGTLCSKKTRRKLSIQLPSRMQFDPFRPSFPQTTPLQYAFFKMNMEEYTLCMRQYSKYYRLCALSRLSGKPL